MKNITQIEVSMIEPTYVVSIKGKKHHLTQRELRELKEKIGDIIITAFDLGACEED